MVPQLNKLDEKQNLDYAFYLSTIENTYLPKKNSAVQVGNIYIR